MTISQFISWCVAAITFGTVIMYGCIGETINQKAGDLNLGVPGVMMIGGIASLAAAFLYENNAANPNPFVSMILTLVATIVASGLAMSRNKGGNNGQAIAGLVCGIIVVVIGIPVCICGAALCSAGVTAASLGSLQ